MEMRKKGNFGVLSIFLGERKFWKGKKFGRKNLEEKLEGKIFMEKKLRVKEAIRKNFLKGKKFGRKNYKGKFLYGKKLCGKKNLIGKKIKGKIFRWKKFE